MNVGIIVYSKTGNTLSVATKLEDVLRKQGHDVTLEKVTAVNDEPNSKDKLKLINIPKISGYDKVILGAPIHGFSLCPAMKQYLNSNVVMNGKKINCLITQHFPYSWMGGSRGLKQMVDFIVANGAIVETSAIVHWSLKKREQEINEVVEKLSEL